ncbi:MAG: SDR family NAD(P)-dependent oxidoreductase [Rhodospirillales bacterium]
MELRDKTVIVTGASSGIGAAAAQLFAREGASLVLAARRGDKLNEICDTIRGRGGHAVNLAGDVRDEAYNKALVDLALSEFGRLDGAFNNAGSIGEMTEIAKQDLTGWRDVIDVNLTSAFLAARYQAPAMLAGGRGAILFTSSFRDVPARRSRQFRNRCSHSRRWRKLDLEGLTNVPSLRLARPDALCCNGAEFRGGRDECRLNG